MSYTLPIIPPDLHEFEARDRMIESLEQLDQIFEQIINSVQAKVANCQDKAFNIGNRIYVCQQKIASIENSNRAITIYSSPKFPQVQQQDDFLFPPQERLRQVQVSVHQPADPGPHPNGSIHDVNELNAILRAVQVPNPSTIDTVRSHQAIGFGGLPKVLTSVNSLIMFNSAQNPYKIDYLEVVQPKETPLQKMKISMALPDAPNSLQVDETIKAPNNETQFISDNNAPQLELPSQVKLEGIAALDWDDEDMDDDSGFIMPSAKLGFLPSVPNFQGGPQEYQQPLPNLPAYDEQPTTPVYEEPVIQQQERQIPPPPPPPPVFQPAQQEEEEEEDDSNLDPFARARRQMQRKLGTYNPIQVIKQREEEKQARRSVIESEAEQQTLDEIVQPQVETPQPPQPPQNNMPQPPQPPQRQNNMPQPPQPPQRQNNMPQPPQPPQRQNNMPQPPQPPQRQNNIPQPPQRQNNMTSQPPSRQNPPPPPPPPNQRTNNPPPPPPPPAQNQQKLMQSMNIPQAANPNAKSKLLADIRNKDKLVTLKKTVTKEAPNRFIVKQGQDKNSQEDGSARLKQLLDNRLREIDPAPIRPRVLLNQQETQISDEDSFSDQ